MWVGVVARGLVRAWAALSVLLVACTSDPAASNGAGSAAPNPIGSAGTTAGVTSAPPLNGAGSNAVAGTSQGSAGTLAQPAAGMVAPPVAGASGSGGAAGAPAPQLSNADWRMMGYDHASTYFNSAETKLTKANAAMLAEAWTANLGGNVYAAPLQVGDKIYAAGPATVRAFDAASGNELWNKSYGSTASMAYADGTLYLNDNTSAIVAIDAADGSMKWSKPSNPSSMADGSSSPLVVGDVILIGGSNGSIELVGGAFRGFMAALDRATGSSKWVTYTVPEGARGASLWSSPSADLEAGIAYGATGNNYGSPATDSSDAFIAFDLMTGAIKWKSQRVMGDTFGGLGGIGPDADFGANPVLYQTMVGGVLTKVIGAGNKGGEAHAVRADNGMMLWERSLCSGAADGSRGIFTNSTWTGKYLLVACNAGSSATLYALDGATGEIGWMRQLSGPVWGRTAVANGVGFVGTGTKLEVFDVDTGDMIKSFNSKGGTVAGTITVANGRVAFGEGLSWSNGIRGSTLTVLAVP